MSQPAHKIRIGVLQVTIWRNHGEKGNWYSVIPSRSYKQGDETWKETDSLGFDDLLTMAKLFDLAHTWIMHQQQADAKGPQRIRSGSSLTPDAGGWFAARRLLFQPSKLNGVCYDLHSMHTYSTPAHRRQQAGEIPAQCPPHRRQSRHGRAEGVAARARPDAKPRRHRRGRRHVSRHRRRPPPGGDPFATGRGQAAGGFRGALPDRHRGARPGNEPCRKHRPAGHAPGRPV